MSIFTKIISWITGATAKVKSILKIGTDAANFVKSIADSPILDLIVQYTPTDIDNKLLPVFRKLVTDAITALGWADRSISDFDNEAAKASVLHVISAVSQNAAAQVKHVDFNIQTALSSPQLVYDASKGKLV